MLTDRVPENLARRQRVWGRLLEQHHKGVHHPMLCASPQACEAYERVLTAQNDLVAAALKLPPAGRDHVAQGLEKPGPLDFFALVAEASDRPSTTLDRGAGA